LADKIPIQFPGALVTKAEVVDREIPITALALTFSGV
jgi:hypothetical protein